MRTPSGAQSRDALLVHPGRDGRSSAKTLRWRFKEFREISTARASRGGEETGQGEGQGLDANWGAVGGFREQDVMILFLSSCV